LGVWWGKAASHTPYSLFFKELSGNELRRICDEKEHCDTDLPVDEFPAFRL
jgi:hypothetical protein